MDEGIECWCWLRNKKDESGKDTDVVFGRLYISLDKSSSASLLISVIHFSIFFRGRLPLPRKRPHIEKYYPFPRYKIKPKNGSEYTKFHFDSH
jgi:hypothetical protein